MLKTKCRRRLTGSSGGGGEAARAAGAGRQSRCFGVESPCLYEPDGRRSGTAVAAGADRVTSGTFYWLCQKLSTAPAKYHHQRRRTATTSARPQTANPLDNSGIYLCNHAFISVSKQENHHETYLPAFHYPPQAYPRLPRSLQDPWWSRRSGRPSRQGPQASGCITLGPHIPPCAPAFKNG